MDEKQKQLITILITFFATACIVGLITGYGVWIIKDRQLKAEKVKNDELRHQLSTRRITIGKSQTPTQNQHQTPSSSNNSSASQSQNKIYNNQRFAFSIEYPSNWSFTTPQDGDGIILTKESQEIRVYGTTNAQGYKDLQSYATATFGSVQTEDKTVNGYKGLKVDKDSDVYLIFMKNNGEVISVYAAKPDSNTLTIFDNISSSLRF
ncbi:MAG: hypothetical protein C4562_04400 [Actinobacteria bacterium]|nr:MAG: hypothetical protein C4562_04400 [Actinomycetota bacterium]